MIPSIHRPGFKSDEKSIECTSITYSVQEWANIFYYQVVYSCMYFVVFGVFLFIVFIEFTYILVGRRKKLIDQYESDVRIFLVLVLIVSFYVLFFSISLLYFTFFTASTQVKYFFMFIYFLIPPGLGVLLYVILPWVCGRNLELTDTGVPDTVHEVGRLLHIPVLPQVKTTPLQISPLVYGRSGNNSIFVLPDMSFLTEKEQKAVIAHELSHIKQGDVGFFTWLTLLTDGLKYWIIPFPLVVFSQFAHSYIFNTESKVVFVVLIPVFLVLFILLKNSLSRTRESIADAYVVFHGLGTPLKSALYTYATRTTQKVISRIKWVQLFLHLRSGLSTHPPLLERLNTIDKKTYLTETMTNLSPELALWTGLAAAFLFYALYYAVINFFVVFDLSMSESASFVFWAVLFFATANVVAASYVFPITKESVLFLDFGDRNFVILLVRNMIITGAAAVLISYGLSFDGVYTQSVATAVLAGFLFLALGFAGARRSDFSHGEEYLVLVPVSWGVLLWYPVQKVHSFFLEEVVVLPFLLSMLSVMVLAFVIVIILMEKGQLLMTRKDKILMLFGKRKEFPKVNDAVFVFLVLVMLLVPLVVSFAVCIVSFLIGAVGIVPGDWIMYGVIAVLGVYGLKKSDILFFHKIFFLIEIVPNVDETERQFIQKVVNKYQVSDGGFDYAGVGFSNQKDTFYFVKTAEMLTMQLDNQVAEWIMSCEGEQDGFALFTGGYPRVKGLYYAVQSLQVLDGMKHINMHVQWVCDSFNGEYFSFLYDTDSLLLQTCYAVELLHFFGALDIMDLNSCRKWIESYVGNLKPKEAYFVIRALKILHSDVRGEEWLDKNDLSETRVDKNVEEVYYYVKVLRELGKEVPSLIVEQAARELIETRKEYEKRF